MSLPNDSDRPASSGVPPVRPWGPPAGESAEAERSSFSLAGYRKIPILSVLIFALLISGVLIRAFRDVSRPEAWEFWWGSSSLTASLVQPAPSAFGSGKVLAVSGKFDRAAANGFRKELDDAKLRAGDTVAFSSPGGNVTQAIIIGEEIRMRGLNTAVAAFDGSGRMRAASCASACVLAYAGGAQRIGLPESRLGVHRFTTTVQTEDSVADTQQMVGLILAYIRRMGVSSTIMEMMSATEDIRWLTPQQAADTKLVTVPLAQR
jgi:hypothetical protein